MIPDERHACMRKSRIELNQIARRSLGRPYTHWQRLNKANLCEALGDHFEKGREMARDVIKQRRSKRKSTAREKLNASIGYKPRERPDDIISARLKILDHYPCKDAKFVKTLGQGIQGRADLFRCKSFDFVTKVNKIEARDMTVIRKVIKKNEEPYDAKKLVGHKALRGTEVAVEAACAVLADQLVRQGICPHFPLYFAAKMQDGRVTADMECVPGRYTLAQWGKRQHSESQWFSVLFQIIVAAHSLWSQYGIVHDDLHAENVLMYELGKKWTSDSYFHYKVNEHDYYVPVYGEMACIIDFGRCYKPKALEIKWHLNHRGKRTIDTFDVLHLIGNLIDNRDAPKRVSDDILKTMEMVAEGAMSYTEVFDVFFSKNTHGAECKRTWPACYDIKPTKYNYMRTFDVDKAVDTKALPEEIRALLKD